MIDFHVFDDADAQAEALAQAVAAALQDALTQRETKAGVGEITSARVTLAVSGGKSPVTFFTHLSRTPLDWSRVDVTLVDDRWLPETDADSNARMVRETLLQNAAAAANFVPLVDTSRDPAQVAAALNKAGAPALPDVAVLGMGEDGHTASIFADAPEWEHAATTRERLVIVHPGSAPHARISWSLHALRHINTLFLQIGGGKKRAVLDAAAASPQRNAISRLAVDGGVTIDVYWYA
ncbi:MAG: 6-phosphogluconolactonase [Janthinobacterium lividum]